MINEFLDWLAYTRNAFLLLIVMLVAVFLAIDLGVMFVRFDATPEMLRFAFLMFTILFSIFITWYITVYKK